MNFPLPCSLGSVHASSLNQICFCTSGLVPILMRYPLGLDEVGSDPLPVKQIRTTSGLSIQGQMLMVRSESEKCLYTWPGPNRCVRSPGSARTERSQIQPASCKTGRGPNPSFIFRAGCSSPSKYIFVSYCLTVDFVLSF